MDNRLRETAVSVAVWASTQHAIAEVWFAGPRLAADANASTDLGIIIVKADDTQQLAARRAGRSISTLNWDADVRRAVRGRHTLHVVNVLPPDQAAPMQRVFARTVDRAPEIRCATTRPVLAARHEPEIKTVTRGEIGNARTI